MLKTLNEWHLTIHPPPFLLPIPTFMRWHHSSLSEMATESQGFSISADLRIQLCWYYLCKCQLGTDTITRMSHFRALLNGLILPQKKLGFPHCWWRTVGEIPRDSGTADTGFSWHQGFLWRRPRTPLSDVKQELAAWTLKSDKMGLESWLLLASWVPSQSVCFLSEFQWELNKAMCIKALRWPAHSKFSIKVCYDLFCLYLPISLLSSSFSLFFSHPILVRFYLSVC